MSRSTLVLLALVVLVLAACGGGGGQTASVPAGDATKGQALFEQKTIGKDNLQGCSTCHSIQKGVDGIGPSLAGIGTDAAGSVKVPEYKGSANDAAGWLKESIVSPNTDIADGFQVNVMPQNFKDELTDQQVNDLVAYLMTQN
jgi:cytochrome c2